MLHAVDSLPTWEPRAICFCTFVGVVRYFVYRDAEKLCSQTTRCSISVLYEMTFDCNLKISRACLMYSLGFLTEGYNENLVYKEIPNLLRF